MRSVTSLALVFVALALVLAAAPQAQAQTNDEVTTGLRFDFVNPGARSLAMGGAFTALAADATAAYTNPAGLTQVFVQEIHAEGRWSEATEDIVQGGTVGGDLEFLGVTSTTFGPSFLSYVRPWSKMSLAVFRHELANFDSTWNAAGAFYQRPLESGMGTVLDRIRPVTASTDLSIANYGVSLGFAAGKKVSVGVGLSLFDFDLDSQTRRYRIDLNDAREPAQLFNELTAADTTSLNFQRGSDQALGFTVGALFKPIPRLAVALTYRSSASFDVEAEGRILSTPGAPWPTVPGSDGRLGVDDACGVSLNCGPVEHAKFVTPEVISLGVLVQAHDKFLISVQYDRIDYSELAKLTDVFNVTDGGGTYEADPVNLYRLGMEFTLRRNVLLRAGAWREEDSDIRFIPGALTPNPAQSVTFRPGEDAWHVTLGAGIDLSDRFTMDFGVDLSEPVNSVAASFIARLGRLD